MKYIIKGNGVFGWEYTTYDTETMTCAKNSKYGLEQLKEITKEEMRQFIDSREFAELKNLRYEMAKLQQKYDEKFAEIKKFKKALDNC